MRFTRDQSLSLGILGLLIGLVSSCTPSPPSTQEAATPASLPVAATDAPKVVATSTVLCDLVKQIAEATVNLTCLLQPGVDGHVYQPVPADRKAIEQANLILYSGYDFEPGLIKLIQSTSNPAPKVAVGEKAVTQPLIGHDHDDDEATAATDHDHDHDQGAGADLPDPHVWHNAANGARMAAVVTTELTQLAPANKALYAKNGKALEAELTQLHQWIKTQIASIPVANRKLVTTHDAMKYFSEAYDIPVSAALQGISTKEKPTATRVRALVDAVKSSGVSTIFAEVVVNPKLIEAVARDAKVQVSDRELYTDSLGAPTSEAATYPQMLIANTRTIVEGLNGKFIAFQPKP